VLKTIFREYLRKDQWQKTQPSQKEAKGFVMPLVRGAMIFASALVLGVKIGSTKTD
jgi:hypothetical protein